MYRLNSDSDNNNIFGRRNQKKFFTTAGQRIDADEFDPVNIRSHRDRLNLKADHWNGIIRDLVSGSADMSFAPLSVSKWVLWGKTFYSPMFLWFMTFSKPQTCLYVYPTDLEQRLLISVFPIFTAVSPFLPLPRPNPTSHYWPSSYPSHQSYGLPSSHLSISLPSLWPYMSGSVHLVWILGGGSAAKISVCPQVCSQSPQKP